MLKFCISLFVLSLTLSTAVGAAGVITSAGVSVICPAGFFKVPSSQKLEVIRFIVISTTNYTQSGVKAEKDGYDKCRQFAVWGSPKRPGEYRETFPARDPLGNVWNTVAIACLSDGSAYVLTQEKKIRKSFNRTFKASELMPEDNPVVQKYCQ